ncbi:MAG: RNA methyltransferase [Saprospiraceae bacterium]
MELITSLQNKKVLSLRKLYKSSERKKSELFIAEGYKETLKGLKSGLILDSFYFCDEIIKPEHKEEISNLLGNNVNIFEINKQVYEKLVYRDNTEGLLAVFKKKNYSLDEILPKNSHCFYIILESIEKPGNMGAVLRTADAVGADAVIITESLVDQYNPNVVRASLGTLFNIPVVSCSNKELLQWVKANNIKTYAAALPAFDNLYEIKFEGSTAMIFGSESNGLGDFWINNSDKVFTIPMDGTVDSLNISVSVAISAYEVYRQKL